MFIHHTVSAYIDHFDAAYMRALEESEIARGGYIALAYQMMILPNGDIVESRPWGTQGGATINNNSSSVAVCFIGNYENQSPTEASLNAAGAAIQDGINHGAISPGPRVMGHFQVFSTACPGANLRGRLGDIAARIGGGVALGPPPPPPYPIAMVTEEESH